jgi:hypothetical protein
MSLRDVKLIGWQGRDHPLLQVDEVLKQHDAVRDAVANTVHRELDLDDSVWQSVATHSFTYAFNAYKAIGLVLAQSYHESASAILRQLWEVSLNMHWIERDSTNRAQDFCNFTVMEMRKQMADKDVSGITDQSTIQEFDSATSRFQSKFHLSSKQGHAHRHSNFACSSVESRSKDLGDPWRIDYALLYRLTSMHAHGAPGAILRPMFLNDPGRREIAESDSTSLVAIVSMQLLVRDVHLLVRQGILPSSATVDEAVPPEARET